MRGLSRRSCGGIMTILQQRKKVFEYFVFAEVVTARSVKCIVLITCPAFGGLVEAVKKIKKQLRWTNIERGSCQPRVFRPSIASQCVSRYLANSISMFLPTLTIGAEGRFACGDTFWCGCLSLRETQTLEVRPLRMYMPIKIQPIPSSHNCRPR